MGKIKKFIEFIRHGVWTKGTEHDETDDIKWYVKPFRVLIYTVKGLLEHDVSVRAASLTFYTLMAIVPVLAVILAVVKGFGMDDFITDYLKQNAGQYKEMIEYLLEATGNMIKFRTSGGLVAGIGLVLLFWSVVQVFGNVENAFNNIWEVKRQRSIGRKFSDYISVVIVAPILWIVSQNLVSYVRSGLEPYAWSWMIDMLFGLVSLIGMWIIFAFIYYVMPNTKVKFKGAIIAGIVAGTAFWIFQEGYVYLQRYLTSYNFIYGSLAAIPLLLIWLQWSWMILLVGAELSFAYQNIVRYEMERNSVNMCYDLRRKVMLAAMVSVVQHYLDNDGAVNSDDVADELNMPVRTVRDVLYDLENAGLIVTIKDGEDDRRNYFVPARDVHTMSVYEVIDGVECNVKANTNVSPKLQRNAKIIKVSEMIDGMKAKAKEPPYDMMITDLLEKKTAV